MTLYFCRRILKAVGLHPDRLIIDWASAAEAPLYVALITKFTDHVRELGPLGEAEGLSNNELRLRLGVAGSVVTSVKIRARFARLTQVLREANDYSSQQIESKMAESIDPAVLGEMEKQYTLQREAEAKLHPTEESIVNNTV